MRNSVKRALLPLLFCTALGADEHATIESIIGEVSELRKKYESCVEKLESIELAPAECEVGKAELTARQKEILALRQKNETLQAELKRRDEKIKMQSDTLKKRSQKSDDVSSAKKEKIEMLASEIKKREYKIKIQSKRIKELEAALQSVSQKSDASKACGKEYARLQERLAVKDKECAAKIVFKDDAIEKLEARLEKTKNAKSLPCKPCEKPKPVTCKERMPTLLMQKGYAALDESEEAAHTYRLNKDAPIYAKIYAKEPITTWEYRTSFTSTLRDGEWVKITGYFVDGKWQKAKEELWVKLEDTILRD